MWADYSHNSNILRLAQNAMMRHEVMSNFPLWAPFERPARKFSTDSTDGIYRMQVALFGVLH
jgi:hypothetical protein